MSETPAVFLSYASEDGATAEQIAEALRAARVEVWFDKSELVGGDAWDKKIRDQIQSCTIFVPIISANTQARPEGYFRLEWHLAEQRTFLMAHDQPFLFPVVIDETTDGEARVPNRFRERQWMRLDEASPQVIAKRISGVLLGSDVPTKPNEITAAHSQSRGTANHNSSPPAPTWKKPVLYLGMIVALIAVGFYFLRPIWWSELESLEAETSAAGVSEVQNLLSRADELITASNLSRSDLATAIELCAEAADLDSLNPAVWGTWSRACSEQIFYRFDTSTENLTRADEYLAKALRLDPQSLEARYAQLVYWRLALANLGPQSPHWDEALTVSRELLEEAPDDPRMIANLGILLASDPTTHEQGIARLTQLAEHPGWAEQAWNNIGWFYLFSARFSDAADVAAKALTDKNYPPALILNAFVHMHWTGDLDQALTILQRMPPGAAREDWTLATRVQLLHYREEPVEIMPWLMQHPREWIDSQIFQGPKSWLSGEAHHKLGNHLAARTDYEHALQQINDQLAVQHNSSVMLDLKARTLLRLGRDEEARQTYQLIKEIGWDWHGIRAFFDVEATLDELEARFDYPDLWMTASAFRHWDRHAPLRDHPRFQALLARAEASPKHTPNPKKVVLDAPAKSIAVLPFANRSANADDAYFTDGIHDDLLTQISRIRDIKTISRTSVMAYRDTTKNMKQIGEELGVATLLEGGVQRSGNRVRINMQLIDAQTDTHLWAETYTRELSAENLFEIQSEIATAIAGALQAVLSPEEQKQIEKLPTHNMAALEAFFHGRASYAHNTSEGYSEAMVHFQQAVDLDPAFAEAYAQLALATLEKIYYGGFAIETQTALATPLVERALELDPTLSEAYQALGYLGKYRYNYDDAKAAFERAIQLNPNNAAAFMMFGNLTNWELASPEQAIELFRKAMLLDPQNRAAEQQFGEAFMNAGRFAKAKAIYEALIVKEPEFAQTYTSLGNLFSWRLYQFDDAIKAYRQALVLDPASQARSQMADTYLELGMPDAAIPWYESYIEFAPDSSNASSARYDLHLIRGRYSAAEEALKADKTTDWYWRSSIDRRLAALDMDRGHPELARARFEASFPLLTDSTSDINETPYVFKAAIVYAATLHASGETELADSMTKRVLEILPSKHRHRWSGIEYLDAWLYLAMGDEAKALNALREWREAGGCLDLTKSSYLRPLFEHPEFQALNQEMLAELAEQRANVERMEAAGELAPIPPLPDETL